MRRKVIAGVYLNHGQGYSLSRVEELVRHLYLSICMLIILRGGSYIIHLLLGLVPSEHLHMRTYDLCDREKLWLVKIETFLSKTMQYQFQFAT